MSLQQRYVRLQQSLHAYPKASLIAISKYTDITNIQTLADMGQTEFGESRPQQLRDRAQLFPNLNFHMIGPLQKNKAKYIGRYAHMWHSMDKLETAERVNQYVTSTPLATLLQVQVDSAQQHGVPIEQVKDFYREACLFRHLNIQGLMCMAPRHQNARKTFQTLKTLLCDIGHGKLSTLSMGMSGDFTIALEEGSSMIRVGNALFKGNHS